MSDPLSEPVTDCLDRPDHPGVEELVVDNIAMARRLARRYALGGRLDEDLEQVAVTGLFLAARRYEAGRGPFRPFAIATIVGELKKYLREHGWAVRVPRRLQEQSIAAERAVETLTQQLGRSPTAQEIARETGLSTEQVLEALRATDARFRRRPPRQEQESPGTGIDLADSLTVQAAIGELDEEGGRLLHLRYVEEMSQREIGRRLNISQAQVHRRLNAVHLWLRRLLDNQGYEP